MSRSLRAGTPVEGIQDLLRAGIVVICGGDVLGMGRDGLAPDLDWRRKIVVISGRGTTSSSLAPLRERGAHVASVSRTDEPTVLRYFVEGNSHAVRTLRRILVRCGAQVVEIGEDAQPLGTAASAMASWILIPHLEAAALCLRAAGLTPKRAAPVIHAMIERTMRSYFKGGARVWKPPATTRHRSAFLGSVAAIRKRDPELASRILEAARFSVRSMGAASDWLESQENNRNLERRRKDSE